MKIFRNSGLGIETPEQMVVAMKSSGGISGVRVTLCGPQSSEKPPAIKWDGVSFLNNMEYTKDGIRVCRVYMYNVGKGKFISWSEVNIPNTYVWPTLNTVTNRTPHISFNVVKARRLSEPQPDPLTAVESQSQSTEDDDSSDSEDESGLFFCREEGCTRSFQRFSSLQKHLDYGSHKYALERETLYDKAMLGYAAKLGQGATVEVPEIPTADIHLEQPHESVLQKGWALKSTKQRKRLSEI